MTQGTSRDRGPEHHWADTYIVPKVLRQLAAFSDGRPLRVLDIGCGDGYAASCYSGAGHEVAGFDSSEEEIARARAGYPALRLEVGSLYDGDFFQRWKGPFDAVIALEVVEHLFHPKVLFDRSHQLLIDGGHLIVSTPYHGYWKNLALALLGRWDRHHAVEWDGGHIKFFSKLTLAAMARKAGFKNLKVVGVGRLPLLWKSMILVADK